jgi:hypothetical protein
MTWKVRLAEMQQTHQMERDLDNPALGMNQKGKRRPAGRTILGRAKGLTSQFFWTIIVHLSGQTQGIGGGNGC